MNSLDRVANKRAKLKSVKILMKGIILWFKESNKNDLLILHDDLLEQISTDSSLKITQIDSSLNQLIH